MYPTSTPSAPRAILRSAYLPPTWEVEQICLDIDLAPQNTSVSSTLTLRRTANAPIDAPLHLNGRDLQLDSLTCDGAGLDPDMYILDYMGLTITGLPKSCTLQIRTRLNPGANTALEGLYLSSKIFCTQCEPEGFRRITFFPDRPDVMACYTTTLRADKRQFPVLLSNGNLTAYGDMEDGRHFSTWEDPFPKPSYLFALVAGDLHCLEHTYRTRSGRDILLQLYVEHRNADKCEYAMHALHKAMGWDEERFGLECDLERYMIVAVDDFNMGAMENKGLNIFNSRYVLARPETATDSDFLDIESVIGHEYFHNWTGNRITCRDWFQLSLKEGLTVFRDQEFSADMNSSAIKRIEDVRLLQTHQFSEDAGPTAHPVRPESYIEINNFYTMTIYHKGAEVIRMLKVILGWEGFTRGMRLYIERHDGQAVTIDHFIAAMADSNDTDLSQFKRWYSQAGTPKVNLDVTRAGSELSLHLRQSCPPTPGQEDKQPFMIPVKVALFDAKGNKCPLQLKDLETQGGSSTSDETVLILNAAEQTFTFSGVPADVTPSVLREYSAPVKLETSANHADLTFLMRHDNDPVTRWQAAQTLMLETMLSWVINAKKSDFDNELLQAWRASLTDTNLDPSLIALVLTLPTEGYLAERLAGKNIKVDPAAIHQVYVETRKGLAQALACEFKACYHRCRDHGPYTLTPAAIGNRSLKNLCLSYLTTLDDTEAQRWLWEQYRNATNMTDASAALGLLAHETSARREQALAEFYTRWQDDSLVIDKWLALQARADRSDCLQQVQQLLQLECFNLKNPNRVRALIGTFSQANPVHFHAPGGSGYSFLRTQVEILDTFNPQIAARLVTPLLRWPKYEMSRSTKMKENLLHLSANKDISADLYEMVSRGLTQ